MSSVLIVNGTPYEYPDPGENPNWGEDAFGWAQAVTEVLNTILALGDILETEFTVNNNVAVASDVNGLIFDPGVIRSAEITYNIYRITDSVTSGNAESGKILLVYDDNAPATQKWSVTQQKNGEAGVVLQILDSGQVQYLSTNIAGANYFGLIKFSAKVLGKT